MNKEDKAAFTPRDMKAVRLLAVALGIITAVECLIAKSTEMLVLVIGVNVATMILCPLTIYLLRKARTK